MSVDIFADMPGLSITEDGIILSADASVSYSDVGPAEELDTLEDLRQRPWREVVRGRYAKSRPWLYQIITDGGRALFLDSLPFAAQGRYLDVGSGWGQITLPLSRLGNTYALDSSLSRIRILREITRQEGADPTLLVGNFLTFPFPPACFDLVIMNGVLEWIALGAPHSDIPSAQRRALEISLSILEPGGLLYVGIENALGLKYLLGSPDDHTGRPFEMLYAVERRAEIHKAGTGSELRVHTWTLAEYQAMFTSAGFEISQIYGCFPDYKLMRSMIPLERVNETLVRGAPTPEHTWDGTPLSTATELDAIYRKLAGSRIAQHFCPSFGFVLRKP